MTALSIPWLELAILTPLVGGLFVYRLRDPEHAWWRALATTALALLWTSGAWWHFATSGESASPGPWDVISRVAGGEWIVVDELSAPLLPLAALLYFTVVLATLRTKARRFSFAGALVSLSLLVALLACRQPWGIIALLALQLVVPWYELRSRGRSTRVLAVHMAIFLVLLIAGYGWLTQSVPGSTNWNIALGMIVAAVLVRSGVVPVHCWMTDLFENATFGTALLFVTPMSGAYAAVRLVLPIAPSWALGCIAVLSLATAVYAAGMALVQREPRRFFCYLFLSHSSLVLVGLEVATPVALTGGLCVWLSVGLSLAGLGLTLRAIESRCGQLLLDRFHGLYDHMPGLAVFFLLTGLASIGFPGTIGFIGAELLVDGVVDVTPVVGMVVAVTAALNGIAILRAYFRLFTGTQHSTSICLRIRLPERIAVLTFSALILGGGLIPQPGVENRYRAASQIIARREDNLAAISRVTASKTLSQLKASPTTHVYQE